MLGYPEQSPQLSTSGHSHQSPGHGRVSVTDSYHGQLHEPHLHPGHQAGGYHGHDQYQPLPPDQANYTNYDNYGQYYDPNMSNSVFEDSGEVYQHQGMMTPLPGTLGSVSHTPVPTMSHSHPREAPRAVFDEDQEQEPAPLNRPKSSVGSVHNPGLFLFCFYLWLFFYNLCFSPIELSSNFIFRFH